MQVSQIPKILFFLFSVILGLNLLSYTVQPYIPSSSEHSLSYTVENCPSHRNGNEIPELVLFFIKSHRDDGNQKHCFCYTCNYERFSSLFVKPFIDLIIANYVTKYSPFENDPSLNDLTGHLLIRAPPILVS